jgi:hypothetical protein
MITRDDRDILRATLLVQTPLTTTQIAAHGWGTGAWGKLKDFETAKVTHKVGNPKPPFNPAVINWELTPQGRTLLQQPEPVASATRFLRFGAWCACECSCNSDTKILEAGVSVYECYPDGAHWRYIDSRAISKNERSLEWTPWVLVTGTVQPTRGLGDGEPLLKNVTVVSALQWDPAQKRFAVLAPIPLPHKPHPGYGQAGGCVCA